MKVLLEQQFMKHYNVSKKIQGIIVALTVATNIKLGNNIIVYNFVTIV